ncbi:DUF1015 domain-containing protein [Blautia liquoris]|uniref:DUF1015 domain-containing protein n=1 Tax=Blautia liquoris TaxID=2779518 RepID=A0A7M2RDS4_9FIRM|nr:DUF1015 domain-containing protein [Blautia liquoris]QOV18308.1 DUF1015 domain-containing protein [Blautia liquoris]
MTNIRPFRALRPSQESAAFVAALPYDVYSKTEARKYVKEHPYSFLRIDRPETQFDEKTDMYASIVYQKANETFEIMQQEGTLIEDANPCYYIYELTKGCHRQTGLCACSSVEDYLAGVIKKHEKTRAKKEEDRTKHIDVLSAQTGPVLLIYRANPAIQKILELEKKKSPIYDFTADDGVVHRVWSINNPLCVRKLTKMFETVDHTYIADGHHRAASAVRVAKERAENNPHHMGNEEYNYFLSVLFADSDLGIEDYNRVIKDMNGHSRDEILELIGERFTVQSSAERPVRPKEKGQMGFFLSDSDRVHGTWYRLQVKKEYTKKDPVGILDVEYLQREILKPVFGIEDPRSDDRIDFVGGIRGLDELEKRCHNDCICAFALYPTSMEELLAAADADMLMPPKSTWFEPKLRSGLFIHKIERF